MGESTERERQKEWADELRSEIDDLRHGVDDPSRPKSARELTDEAAANGQPSTALVGGARRRRPTLTRR